MQNWPLLAGAAIALALLPASPAAAGTHLNTVGEEGFISGAGHHVEVTIILACDEGERARFGATVTQDDAVGTGQRAARCSGDVQHLTVTVAAAPGEVFQPGSATVDAWVELRHGQHTHPRHTWTEEVTLEGS